MAQTVGVAPGDFNSPDRNDLSIAGSEQSDSTIICIGDSITSANSVRPNTPLGADIGTAYTQTLGWLPWALTTANGLSFSWNPTFGNFGVGGDTTTNILARMGPILASKASIATLLIGINDISGGIVLGGAPATVLANLKANYLKIVSMLRAAGIRPICFTILPAGGSSGMTDNMRNTVLAFNAWLRAYGPINGIEVFDAYRVLADTTSATGAMLTGSSIDGLHPNATGAFRLGQAFATHLQSHPPKLKRTTTGVSDLYVAASNPQGNLLANAGFITTQAMPAIAPLTTAGVAPASWTVSRESGTSTAGTVTGSMVASADGNGNWFELDFAGLNGAAEVFRFLYAIPTNTIAFSEYLDGFGEVEQVAGQTGGALNSLGWILSDGTNGTVSYTAMSQGTSAGVIPTDAYAAYLEIPPLQIAASGTLFVRMIGRVSIQVSGSYSGKVRFRHPTVRKRVV